MKLDKPQAIARRNKELGGNDTAFLVQRADRLLEVAFADPEQVADQLRLALVADGQGAAIGAQLVEDGGVQAAAGLSADGLQAQGDLAVAAQL
nr:hypothetical protein [Tanacetum cinerariifolium]